MWTVPARRTKANREHRVPLCGRALEILDGARTLVKGTRPYLFPNRLGKQLEEKQLRRMLGKHKIAAVPHGFRSASGTGRPRKRIILLRSDFSRPCMTTNRYRWVHRVGSPSRLGS